MGQHKPKKRFGQHFLCDQAVLASIINAINPHDNDPMIEIGPGRGALTEWVLPKLNQLHAIEIDHDLIDYLTTHFPSKLIIHQQDALKFDFNTLYPNQRLRIIGNLPYNISTPLLFHLFNYADHIHDMHFMLQKEVIDRLVARPGNKHYGRLSVMTQFFCRAQSLIEIPPEAFDPPPKVNSAFVRLTTKENRPTLDHTLLSRIVFLAFNQRRKTLSNSLKQVISADQLERLGINPRARPEELDGEKFVEITAHLSHSN
jgi:16S rRNA (adenine1518-N6/adenine1519-N6)-dimethyltransferase